MAGGRPRIDDSIIHDAIQHIASGLSIRKSCAAVGISTDTFLDRVAKPEFSVHYARAMEARADTLFDQIADIADNDDPEADVQRDRLRVDARKWVVSKMLPKKYAERITQEITGANGSPIQFQFVEPPNAAAE